MVWREAGVPAGAGRGVPALRGRSAKVVLVSAGPKPNGDERGSSIFSARRESTGCAVVPPRTTNRPGGGVASEGRGRGPGKRPSAATPPDPGAESGNGGKEILHHERTPADRRTARAAGRVHALACGTRVPRGQK